MIFEDPERRRWHRALVVFSLLVLTVLITVGLVVVGYIVPPQIPNVFSHSTLSATEIQKQMEKSQGPTYTPQQAQRMAMLREVEKKKKVRLLQDVKKKTHPLALPLQPGVVVGFSIGDDPHSVASLEQHVPQLDVVVPSWFELTGNGCELTEKADAKTRRILSRADVLVLPRLANLSRGQWRGPETGKILADPKLRACLAKKVTERLVALSADGLNLDLEDLTAEDNEPFLEFLIELRTALHARSMRLTVDVPFDNPAYDYEYIGEVADAVMVMAYDEHFPSSQPGAIAGRDWLADSLRKMLPRLPPDRVVVVLGAYGYDWTVGKEGVQAESLSFRNAVDRARAASATPTFQPKVENSHFGYTDADGNTHDVWFQDALAFWNQVAAVKAHGVPRLGLWRLGTEDETIWSFFGATSPPARPEMLAEVPPGRNVEFYGQGEVLSMRSDPTPGKRTLVVDPHGHITQATYLQVPSGSLVERRPGPPRMVLLTFDDGPTALWTPKILDALKELKAPALFFVVGDQAMRFPRVVQREVAEGHLVGNHSYSHPHMEQLTPREAAVQLRATQRLLQGLTGGRSPLFRAPYSSSLDPEDPAAFGPLQAALKAGYLVVGATVDADDWKKPGVDAIANQIIDEVTKRNGGILLLHDGGGDRSETADALRRFVPELRRRGFEFASLDKFLGLPREVLAVPLPWSEQAISWGNAALAYARAWGWTVLATLFFVCTVLAILRILFLGSLTLNDLRRKPVPAPTDFRPLVTILVPAYNEEKVIASTVRSLLESEYANVEILVIDDGSKDKTSEVVEQLIALEPRVRLVRQENGGKAAAANHGLAVAKGEIIVAVDADTLISPQSIAKLVPHFARPEVTAVCGNVEVGNVNGVLTAFQAIEYVTSQNFDRRAFSALNCISVVPGALGAWRRAAVLAVGGYSKDTLTEDADLTLTILRAGGKVVYEPEAYGRTEAPETLGALLKQRFRWTYGTYQCLFKHRAALGHGPLGWIGMPNMYLFQILFPTLSPIGDVVMLLSIFRGDWRAFLAGYLAFLAMDLCGSLLAFTLDRKPLRWLLLLVIQRFSYRQIMYYVSLKAMLAALRGRRHGWRKLDRTGSVSAAAPTPAPTPVPASPSPAAP